MGIFKDKKTKLDMAKDILKIMGVEERHLQSVEKSAMINRSDLKDIIMEEAKASVDQLMAVSADIYADTFTKRDLRELLDFCNSRAGKKYFEAAGSLEILLAGAGQNWSHQLLRRSEERYQKEYLKRKAEEGIVPSQYIPPLNLKF